MTPIDLACAMTDLQSPSIESPDNRNSVCLMLAISYTCFKVICPTLSFPGVIAPRGLPLRSLTPAELRMRYEVVGVRSSK